VVAAGEREQVRGRSIVVWKLKPLLVEAVVRGYLEGSGWKEYGESQSVCGIRLPPGLERAAKLPQPIFTPATKAEAGMHDENISFERMAAIVGEARAKEVRDVAVRLYTEAAEFALTKGIIIADTKFEFGVDANDRLHLIDEILTPDSSRFWPLATYRVGESPESFDKQYVRNWLDSIGFARKPPAPDVPREVALKTSEKYQEALRRLTA
jgi:phosphoribosylaminoimidazole-succinocarboxamide synthase